MVDFLKTNPYMTIEDYMWNYSIPFIKLMALDNTRVNYLTEEEVAERKNRRKAEENKQRMDDLGDSINIL